MAEGSTPGTFTGIKLRSAKLSIAHQGLEVRCEGRSCYVRSRWCEDTTLGLVTENDALETIGSHCLAELYDCPHELLDDEMFIKGAVRTAVDEGLATLLHEVSHHFHPQGVTALGLIAESHVAIHTWPEHGYAAVDVFTCGDRANAEKACLHIVRVLQAGRHTLRKLIRGEDAAAEEQLPQTTGAGVA